MNGHLTTKDLARVLGWHPDTVRRNESRLGLDRVRVAVNARVIVYPRDAATRAMRRAGLDFRGQLPGTAGNSR